MHLVTGASNNHYKSLINMILSFMKYHKKTSKLTLLVFGTTVSDIDLSLNQFYNFLKFKEDIIIRNYVLYFPMNYFFF